ncbi:MAG: SdpI family protein [Candidatus Nealsonbacteria bacterium]
MLFTKKEFLPIFLIILAFIVGFYLYPQLPEKIPSHWNAKGEIDSWSNRNFGVLFFPGITLAVYLFMLFIPLIDPLKKNYQKFSIPYYWFRVIFVVFFVSLYFYTLYAALGTNFNINYFIIPAISILFVVLGIFMPKIKKNYFVGIRTPWTLHSEEVWNVTHKFSGKIFITAGLISCLGLFFSEYTFLIVMAAILSAAFISVIYSYFAFKKIEGLNNKVENKNN